MPAPYEPRGIAATQVHEAGCMLADLRDAGWRVAIHNDYRQGGKDKTFWLLTRGDTSGVYIKGEGENDYEALKLCEAQARKIYGPSP